MRQAPFRKCFIRKMRRGSGAVDVVVPMHKLRRWQGASLQEAWRMRDMQSFAGEAYDVHPTQFAGHGTEAQALT